MILDKNIQQIFYSDFLILNPDYLNESEPQIPRGRESEFQLP